MPPPRRPPAGGGRGPRPPRRGRRAPRPTPRRLTLWNWPGDIEDAVLVTSELVANAVRHGKVPGHEVWLRVAVGEENAALTIDVSDPTPAFPVVTQAPGAENGRGLLVVAALSASLDWFLRGDIGKTVRVQLAVGLRTN